MISELYFSSLPQGNSVSNIMVDYFEGQTGVEQERHVCSAALPEIPNILEVKQERLRLGLRKDFLKARESDRDVKKL